MAGVVDQRSEWFAIRRIKPDDEDFMVAGAIRIDAEETFAGFSCGATICIDVALTAAGAKANGLKIGKGLDRGLRRPAGHILKPRVDHFVTFLDPALIRNG